jgi:glycerate 2-kinase
VNSATNTPLNSPRSGEKVLVAMDKFRGTARARELCTTIESVLTQRGLGADLQPMSDGGEGFTDVFSGEPLTLQAQNPWGGITPVPAVRAQLAGVDTGIFELAEVVGRHHLSAPTHEQAWSASSAGVGEVILALANLGVEEILLGCGGTATSDGGLGCYEVLAAAGGLPCPVRAATDVTTTFLGARRFATQKGIDPKRLGEIDTRLIEVQARYLGERGVNVELHERTGAAGGIPGALFALGAELVDGFALVSTLTGLGERARSSSLVITGEGRLDATSLEGKVTAGIAHLAHTTPTLVICGSSDEEAAANFVERYPHARVVSLEERFGNQMARNNVLECVSTVIAEFVA